MVDSKFMIPQVASIVGVSGALVFGRLLSWFWNRDVVFRTNEEIQKDLGGMLSTATIHRAKHRLVQAGLLTISFDKGFKRTTFFRLTEKALDILRSLDTLTLKKSGEVEKKPQGIHSIVNQPQKAQEENTAPSQEDKVEETKKASLNTSQEPHQAIITKKQYNGSTNKPKVAVNANQAKIDTTLNQGEAGTKAMQESFKEEGRVRPEKSSMPDALKALLNKQKNPAPTEEVSTGSMGLGGIVASVFKSGVSAAQENIYNMTNQARMYAED